MISVYPHKDSETDPHLIQCIKNYVISQNAHHLARARTILEQDDCRVSPEGKKRLLKYIRAKISSAEDIPRVFAAGSWLGLYKSHPENYGYFRIRLNSASRNFSLRLIEKITGVSHIPWEARIWLYIEVLMLLLESPGITWENKRARAMTQSERSNIARALARCLADTLVHLPESAIEIRILKHLALSEHRPTKAKIPFSRLDRAAILVSQLPDGNKILPYIHMRIIRARLRFVSHMSSDELCNALACARTLKSSLTERTRKHEVMFFEILHESAKHFHLIGQRGRSISEYHNCLQSIDDSESVDPSWSPFDPIWKIDAQRQVNTEISRVLMEEGRYKEAQDHLELAADSLEKSLNETSYLPIFTKIELLCLKANLSLIQEDYSRISEQIDSILHEIDNLPKDIEKLTSLEFLTPFAPSLGGIASIVINQKKIPEWITELQLRAQRLSRLAGQKWILILTLKVHFSILKYSINQLDPEAELDNKSLLETLLSIPEISNFHHQSNQILKSQSDLIGSLIIHDDFYLQIVKSLDESTDSIPDILFMRDFVALAYSLIGLYALRQQKPESHRFFERSLDLMLLEIDTKPNVIPYSAFAVLNNYSTALTSFTTDSICFAREYMELIHEADSVFLRLESIRCTYLDSDERARLEALLESAYSELESSILPHLSVLSHSEETKETALRALLGFRDRSRLRWALSLMPNSKPLADFSSDIPDDLVNEYLRAKERLILSRGDFFSINLGSDQVGIAELQILGDQILAHRTGRLSKPEAIPISIEPEAFQGRKLEEQYVSECLSTFQEVTRRIQAIKPLFEADLVANHARPISECFEAESTVAHLHVQIVGTRIVVALHHQSTRFFVLSFSESREIALLETQISNWLAPTDFLTDTPPADYLVETLNPLIHLANRLAQLMASLPRDSIQKLRILLDPTLAWLPLHLLKVSDPPERRYLLEDFSFYYSPSVSLRSRGELEVPADKLTALVASIGDDLPFAKLEGAAVWARGSKVTRLSDEDVSFQNIVARSRGVLIFHFCGHTRSNPLIVDHYLDTSGSERLSVRRCLDTLRLLNSPLVMINACRSSLLISEAHEQAPIPTITRNMKHEEGLATEQLSLATAFLLAGASTVVGTIAEVGDLPAALFAWKFSKLYQEQEGTRSSATAFRSAIHWLRDGINNGQEFADRVFPEFLAEAQISGHFDEPVIRRCREQVASIRKHFPDSPPFSHPRHWAPFVLHH